MKKRNITALVAIMFVLFITSVITPAFSADIMLDTKINQVVTKNDKNGNPFTRFVISETRDMNGVAYQVDTIVMCFGSTVDKAKTFKAGDTLKAIVSQNEYQGRLNYNLIAFVDQAQTAPKK